MKAKKALIQRIVSAVLGTPGLLYADTSTVYGVMNVSFENVRANGATPAGPLPAGSVGATPTGLNSPSRNRVTSNASNIGFRGVEELGRGIRALFQIESTVSMDGSRESPFATRNSGVGLSSDKLGTLIYGVWETPCLLNNGYIDPFYFVVIASPRAIIGKPGYAGLTVTASSRLGTTADASFDRRQGNSVQYWTPNLNGLVARVAYSANEDRTATINPHIWSGSVAYDPPRGTRLPLYINPAYERHSDYFGLSGIGVGAPRLRRLSGLELDKLDAFGHLVAHREA
jgi:predicted porin